MATVPTTIIVDILDKYSFPVKMALTVFKQIFSYGVKEISVKSDKIFIQLTYSPKTTTLKSKFGNLSIKYIRARLNNEEEFFMFEKAIKTFTFDLSDEEQQEASSRSIEQPTYNLHHNHKLSSCNHNNNQPEALILKPRENSPN